MNASVVLLTGGAGNIGRAVAHAFLEAGARVAVPVYKADSQDVLDELSARYPDRLHLLALDLTTERGADAAARDVQEWAGTLDTVVHLVGGYAGGSLLADTPIEVWDRMVELNLKSAFLVARATLPLMLDTGRGGSYVFVSSRAARRGRKRNAAYAAAKAGVVVLAESIAEEYGDRGIRSNVILPDTVDTEANRRAMPDADHDRWTRPEEVARTILFLTSDAASAINGAAVPLFNRR